MIPLPHTHTHKPVKGIISGYIGLYNRGMERKRGLGSGGLSKEFHNKANWGNHMI